MSNKVVLWDMDGTLVDSEPLHLQALEASIAKHNIKLPDNFDDLTIGMTVDVLYKWLCDNHGFAVPFDAWIVEKTRYYMAGVPKLKAFPGALALWQALAAAGVRQAVVSNSDRTIVMANLSALGLIKAKQITVSRNDVLRGKPDPEPYRRALYLLGAEPEDAAVLEDSLPGAMSGLAAGIDTYLVPPSAYDPPEGAHKLASYDAILDVFGLR